MKIVLFIINFKNYEEASGFRAIQLATIAKQVATKFHVKMAISPPQHLLSELTRVGIPVFSQHLDSESTGSTTGFVIPESVKQSNISGSLINHSEHRINPHKIAELVLRLKKLKMISVVCVKNVSEVRNYAKLNPNYIAIEPPDLIGTGRAVSTERPDVILESVKAVQKANNSTRLLCGAGIISGEDVTKAMELGSKGILVASGIVKATNKRKKIEEFARAISSIKKV